MSLNFTKCNLKLLVISIILVVGAIVIQNYYSRNQSQVKQSQKNVFSERDLQNYNGKNIDKLYVAVIGSIFDVSSGSRHYGFGQSYHYFVGKDGSRALITGNFKDESDEKDHVIDLSCDNLLGLLKWRHTFKEKYVYIGKLTGRYYNKHGDETDYMLVLKEKINECREAKEEEKKKEKLYPPCNMAWSESEGTRVWCTTSSGGVLRNWEGVPRQLYSPGEARPICVCVRDDRINNSMLKEYDRCPTSSTECIVYN